MGLCLDSLRDSFNVGILCVGGGAPIKSLALAFTALVALNFRFFLLAGMTFAAPLPGIGIMQ